MNTKYKYYAQHMHMHSCYQPGASMEGHMYHANKLGMKYIWLTDHDIRMGRKEKEISAFDFEGEELLEKLDNGRFVGFRAINNDKVALTKETAFSGAQSMCIQCEGKKEGWQREGVTYVFNRTHHSKSLLSELTIGIALNAECTDWNNARVIFDIQLSQRPPEHKPAHLYFVIGSAEGLYVESHTAVISLLQYKGWHKYLLNLTETVLSSETLKADVGGLDNAFDTISIYAECRNYAKLKTWVDDITINASKSAQEAYEAQMIIAREIGEKYGVTPFVGFEISEAGMHKNCFSEDVPVIPYEALNYKISHEEACEWVRKYNGTFALNHPFACFKGQDISSLDFQEETEKLAKEFAENKCWGAKLIEVGFPMGRYFPLEYHFKLWDLLAVQGQFLTGYGSSDNHSNITSWYDGNNFASWVGVDAGITEPKIADFVEAMKCGRVYTGNPVFINDSAVFETTKHAPMGSIVMMEQGQEECVKFSYVGAEDDWVIKWVRSGLVIKETAADKNLYEDSCIVGDVHGIEPVRVEVYNGAGLCIMLTNPIYFCEKKVINYNLPPERLFMDSVRDKTLLLHIGDTHSETYDWYEKLICNLKPDVIIHTGDMADEVKAGRMPEKRGEYCDKVQILLHILEKATEQDKCKVQIVPGNNDLWDELGRLSPDMELHSPNTIINLEGCRICLVHEKKHIDKAGDIYLYGHSERDELWSIEQNTKEAEKWYLNSLWGVFLLSLPDRTLYCWERPEYAAHIWP